MLKCASVYTYEIDDQEKALAEIKAQLEQKITLLKYSAGIIMCHPEFIESGVMQHLCENLPVDLVGTTNVSQAVNGEAGELILTIFVMTADDVWFKPGITDSLLEGVDAPLKAAFEKVSAGETGSPKLAIIFPPLLIDRYAGDEYLKAVKNIIPGTPYFGMAAVNDRLNGEGSETIHNGRHRADAMSFVLCYGNINPRFFVATLPINNAFFLNAEITKANGNLVHEINNINALKFFEDANFPKNMKYFPLLVNFSKRKDNDGVPVIVGNTGFTEDGTAIFNIDVDEGSTLNMVTCTPNDILSTSLNEIKRINELEDVNGVLLLPCAVRRHLLLGAGKPLAELQIAKDVLSVPFMMCYAGGEICPTSVKNGIPTNRFHNYSLVILVL